MLKIENAFSYKYEQFIALQKQCLIKIFIINLCSFAVDFLKILHLLVYGGGIRLESQPSKVKIVITADIFD